MLYVFFFVLLGINALFGLLTIEGIHDRGTLIAYLIGYAFIAPLVVGALFCIPKKHRRTKRLLKAFCWVSVFSIALLFPKVVTLHGGIPKTIAGKHSKVELIADGGWRDAKETREEFSIHIISQLGAEQILVQSMGSRADGLESAASDVVAGIAENESFRSMRGPFPCETRAGRCIYYELDTQVGESQLTNISAFVEGKAELFYFVGVATSRTFEREKPEYLKILSSLKETS